MGTALGIFQDIRFWSKKAPPKANAPFFVQYAIMACLARVESNASVIWIICQLCSTVNG